MGRSHPDRRILSGIAVSIIFLSAVFLFIRWRRARAIEEEVAASQTTALSFVTDPEVLRPMCEAYFRGFNRCDVAARRRCPDVDAYLAALTTPTPEERLAFSRASSSSSASSKKDDPAWRIAVFDDRAEGGFPHTHGDVMCMPRSSALWDERRLAKTIAHERVHVLQRAFPARFFDAIAGSSSGRVAIASFPADSDVATRRRSNPDLDEYVYVDASTGHAYAMLFDGEEAARSGGLGSARVAWIDERGDEKILGEGHPPPPEYEHPHERLAYESS